MSIKVKDNTEVVKPGYYFLLERAGCNVEETPFELRMMDSENADEVGSVSGCQEGGSPLTSEGRMKMILKFYTVNQGKGAYANGMKWAGQN